MKPSKKTLLVIAVGAFVIVLGGLLMVRSRQVDEQNQLSEQLRLSQSRLQGIQPERLSSQQAELEKQFSQATSQFEAAKAILSQPVDSITAVTTLFEVAKIHGLVVTEMTSPGPTEESLEGATLSVISLTAKVEGDLPNLVNCITTLDSFFTTGVVKSVAITVPEAAGGDNASASVQLVVYTYRGD
ncbi:hypothetical protein ACFLTO_01310 [Chloroflexota bacterium]